MERFTLVIILCALGFVSSGKEFSMDIGKENVYPIFKYLQLGKSKLPKLDTVVQPIPGRWYKVTIVNTNIGSSYVLEFIDFRIDDIEIFMPTESGRAYSHTHTGDAYLFNTRPIEHKNFVFPLPAIYNRPIDAYFKTVQHGPTTFEIKSNIRSYANFASYGFQEYAFLLFFYGISFCMGIYNLIRYIFTKDIIHLTYVFYIMALSLFSLSRVDGLGFEYLWPRFPAFNIFSPQVSLALFVCMSMIFAISWLNIRQSNQPLFHFFMVWIMVRFLGTALVIALFPTFDLKSIDLTAMVTLWVVNYRSNNIIKLSNRLFITAYGCMLAGFLVYSLQDWNLIPHTFLGYYALNIGVFIETILLSMAISEKTRLLLVERQLAQEQSIRQLRDNQQLQSLLLNELSEKERLKDKINRELEQKVRERTEELEAKNKLLQEQKLKIENLASEIDKQYYFLLKENSSFKVDSLWTKRLSFENFKGIFPDDASCLVYMEKLKWQENGFRCSKCGHANFIKNPNNLSRKCSKCTHIESVTANTLFHGVKFPLQKAFYLTYCYIHGMEGNTLTSLSSEIGIRLHTCSHFIGKVKRSLALLPSHGTHEGNLIMKNLLVPINNDKSNL